MSFIRRLFGQEEARIRSSFEDASDKELERHLSIRTYGSFTLTDAVSPSMDLKIIPREGYRYDTYRNADTGQNMPVLMAAASREKLFNLFLELSEPLGPEVDAVLETSHNGKSGRHADLYREEIDSPVLQSMLLDYEDMLLNDGCAGAAVFNPDTLEEVQFDEHKLLIVFGESLRKYEKILRRYGLKQDQRIKFITEAEHVHSSNPDFEKQFRELALKLVADADETENDDSDDDRLSWA